MLNPDYIYSVYDFHLNQEGRMQIEQYEAGLVNQIENGKTVSYWSFDFVRSLCPTDVQDTISYLRSNGFKSANEFQTIPFSVEARSPLLAMKFQFMAKHHKMLEKVYDSHGVVEGMNIVQKYVHYVDVNTGEEFVLYVEDEDATPEVIQNLEAQGYQAIEQTPLMDSITKLTRKHEPVKVQSKGYQLQK